MSSIYSYGSKMKTLTKKQQTIARGRPRSFDPDKALDRAVRVFWRKGYEGASLTDLTKAMGINRPSLYAAFGDKEALFRKVLDRYTSGPVNYVREALNQPTARGVAERLLLGTAEQMCDARNPAGCLLVQGALVTGHTADSVRCEVNSRRRAGQIALQQRLRHAKKEGDLPRDADPAVLARYLMTVTNGMSVQAAGGASGKDLRKVAETALKAWPGSDS
jgi:AcrR family transcriptional regulator